jgi:gentisate 1,2-dioxygenase
MNDGPMPGSNEARALLQALYAEMAPKHLYPLWEVLHALVTPTPASPVRPHRWRYDEARAHLLRAGDLITAEQAERRVLILENPACPAVPRSPPASMPGCSSSCPARSRPATATPNARCAS